MASVLVAMLKQQMQHCTWSVSTNLTKSTCFLWWNKMDLWACRGNWMHGHKKEESLGPTSLFSPVALMTALRVMQNSLGIWHMHQMNQNVQSMNFTEDFACQTSNLWSCHIKWNRMSGSNDGMLVEKTQQHKIVLLLIAGVWISSMSWSWDCIWWLQEINNHCRRD